MLPGRNGYDVLAGLRRDGVWAPVLMLTAKDGDLDQVDAFDLGADDYLTKPFSFGRSRDAVRRSGRRCSTSAGWRSTRRAMSSCVVMSRSL